MSTPLAVWSKAGRSKSGVANFVAWLAGTTGPRSGGVHQLPLPAAGRRMGSNSNWASPGWADGESGRAVTNVLRAQELFGQTGLSPRSFSNHKVVPDFPGWAKPAALTKALVQKTTCSHVDVVLARVRMCHPRACSMRHAPPSLPQHCPLPPTHSPSPSPPRSRPAFRLAFSGLTLRAELSSRPQPLVHARGIDREGERERERSEREREGG